ncbi:hypothetical protein TrLO_g3732 [Triparma laevis f. longispina]|uniref:Uncharacterized protein n=1 Tax=Triparma laevis f. longispina TaxID=1714387 RepID=A0A9W7CKS5_9STRA|nr:hypothetical protein TrLO_g3732 [Triparma laevis f. longispina]
MVIITQQTPHSKTKLSQKQKKLAKRRRAKERDALAKASNAPVPTKKNAPPNPQPASSLPPLPPAPPSSSLDSCETPYYAYAYLSPFLLTLPPKTVFYDPYFCSGLVTHNLKKLLPKSTTINSNVDFYAAIEQNRIPTFDVLITNPPYSGTHISRCLSFCLSEPKPFACLLPSYVYNKDYHQNDQMFMIIPKRRVRYVKSHVVEAKSDVTGRDDRDWTAPFHSFWFCSNSILPHYLTSEGQNFCKEQDLIIARNITEIPNEFRDVTDLQKKRKNPKQRKRDRKSK